MKIILSSRRKIFISIIMSITAIYWIFAIMQLFILLY